MNSKATRLGANLYMVGGLVISTEKVKPMQTPDMTVEFDESSQTWWRRRTDRALRITEYSVNGYDWISHSVAADC